LRTNVYTVRDISEGGFGCPSLSSADSECSGVS
jgi:hypothetical protein